MHWIVFVTIDASDDVNNQLLKKNPMYTTKTIINYDDNSITSYNLLFVMTKEWSRLIKKLK